MEYKTLTGTPKHIFFVEDDLSLINGLSFAMKKQGYEIWVARTCLEAERLWQDGKYDLVILDVSLPDGSGYDLCRKIRETSGVPVMFLTAADEETDIIMGLDIGGDDYIIKPFSLDELNARVTAHLRREARRTRKDSLRIAGELVIHYSRRCVYCGEENLGLTRTEFDIVELLSMNRGQVFSKERIYEKLWGYDSEGDEAIVTEHIRRIRMKFRKYSDKTYIETVWGVGYQWAG